MSFDFHVVSRGAALAVACLLAVPLGVQALGAVTGSILDGRSGQPVRGAEVRFDGAAETATSDLYGVYRAQLPPGTYTIVVGKAGFEPQRISGVEVDDGQVANTSIVLMPVAEAADTSGDGSEVGVEGGGQVAFGEAITVEAEAGAATEEALLAERKRAIQISDSIGAEEIGKSSGGDAAGVLRQVTGISLQDSKYVFVRGLGERYSNTLLNGSRMPSTEFEKKVVPLDLFPAHLLDKVTVSKSYTADKPGDFAAGFVELSTLEFPTRQELTLGLSAGWSGVTTGEPLLEWGGGLSFSGDGGQPLPGAIPDEALVRRSPITGKGFTRQELEVFGEEMIGLWTPHEEASAPYDRGFKLSYGNSLNRLGLVLSAGYDNGYSSRDEEANIFQATGDGGVRPLNTYDFDYSTESVRKALTGNLAYRFGDSHNVRVRSLYTDLSENESRFQEGFFSDVANNIENFRVSYQRQEIDNSQLSGDHYFASLGGAGSVFEWKMAVSSATTEENRRESLYEETRPSVFNLTDNAQSGFMYFNDLEDDLMDAGLSWETYLNGDKIFGGIKVGVARSDSERQFFGRRLRFFHLDTRGIDLSLPAEELFSEENIRADGPGFEIQEITRPTDTYEGDHEIMAAYTQADLALGKRWRLIAGVRFEDSDQQVITLDRNTPDRKPIITEILETDVLPSLNLVYQLRDTMNLRFAASQTLNRPEYRELAPFKFTHIVGGFAVTGNPDLRQATIQSYDLRWEWFPSSGEVIAVGIFYKDFEDPIEGVLLAGAELLETFENVGGAENLGAEIEVRYDIAEALRLLLNHSWVDSEIDLGDPQATPLTNAQRPLVGQPDNVLNLALEWNKPEWGSTVRLLYNFTDDKVARAGGFGQPDVIEEARNIVDLVWSQDLVKGLSIKVSGTNLTNGERLWSQGGGVFRLYEPGRGASVSLGYRFF